MSSEVTNIPSDVLKEQPVEDVMSQRIWPVVGPSHPDRYGDDITINTAREIRDELLATLEERGIDTATVIFSGYGGEPHERDEMFVDVEQTRQDIQSLSVKANRMYANGEFDNNPELHDKYKAQLATLQAELAGADAGKADYFFGDISSLTSSDFTENPIYYAGTVDATIGVYDINQFPDADDTTDDKLTASLTPEEVDRALVLRFHPRFEE